MSITTETIFWTQITSIIAFVIALFVLYRVLVEQKEATIQVQKENIAYLKDQLTEAKSQLPDVLAQRLAARLKLYEEELKRLEQDKSSTQEQVAAKESELHQALMDAREMSNRLSHAGAMLYEFLCPKCNAYVTERGFLSEHIKDHGRDIEVVHDYSVFECGYKIVDGEMAENCTYNPAFNTDAAR